MTADRPFFVTTPIYYVNDLPHLGHAYTTVACDVLARFMRLDGRQVKFLTGTDEHGQKVEHSARAAGISPQEFADRISAAFRDMTRLLDISNDDFIRTTEERHIRGVQALWQELERRGEIYLGQFAGWYSVRDEAFYDESELIDGPSGPGAPTGAEVEWLEEENYFFRLSAWQDRLLAFYDANPDAIAPRSRRNEVISFVKAGLQGSVDLAHQLQLGHPGARQPATCHLCVARRARSTTSPRSAIRIPKIRVFNRIGPPIFTWSVRIFCAFTRSTGRPF